MKKNIINSQFFGYGAGVALYINALLELKSEYLNFKVSEICIIAVLLFVVIFIINEINKILIENYTPKDIKYRGVSNFYRNYKVANYAVIERKYKKIPHLFITKKANYKALLSLIEQ